MLRDGLVVLGSLLREVCGSNLNFWSPYRYPIPLKSCWNLGKGGQCLVTIFLAIFGDHSFLPTGRIAQVSMPNGISPFCHFDEWDPLDHLMTKIIRFYSSKQPDIITAAFNLGNSSSQFWGKMKGRLLTWSILVVPLILIQSNWISCTLAMLFCPFDWSPIFFRTPNTSLVEKNTSKTKMHVAKLGDVAMSSWLQGLLNLYWHGSTIKKVEVWQ